MSFNLETLHTYEQQYEKNHQKTPELIRVITEMEQAQLMLPAKTSLEQANITSQSDKIKPRIAQKAALEALETTYEEGYERAMVVMATGLGKTYLAGFFIIVYESAIRCSLRRNITSSSKLLPTYYVRQIYGLARMPMTKWSGSSKGLITFEDGVFELHLEIESHHREILFQWTRDICLYRLHCYFERRG